MKNNVLNPDNIQGGDIVKLDEPNSKEMRVVTVGGAHMNKVYCEEVGHVLYAQCFALVQKAKKCSHS